ncbi:acylphosphatase, partial [Sphingomonas sp.]
MADPVGRKVRLFGRVQGVFFRQWAIKQARALGVAGWVHNRTDGSL